MIAIIDYGAGNTFNVQKAFDFLGVGADQRYFPGGFNLSNT